MLKVVLWMKTRNKKKMKPEIQAFFETKNVDGKEVLVAVRAMTKEQARAAYPYRPRSKYSESHHGGDALADDTALLMNYIAWRCRMCQAPTRQKLLIQGVCPDCDGRDERFGCDPHKEVK